MSKGGGEVEVSEQRRKSARILALEEEKKEKQKRDSCAVANNTYNLSSKGKASLSGTNVGSFRYHQLQDHDHVFPSKSSTMLPPSLPSLKRGRKQKRLEDLDLFSLAQRQSQQDGENHTGGKSSTIKNDQQPTGVSPIQWIPEKRILEYVLDILQRRDKYKIFAQPVNPEEVETYYTIIKDPMDFGTMRTKLHEGKYTSLEQFERDVFLISSNAMHFNSSNTIYYKEARRMRVLAQMVFGALRTDPYKFEAQFSLTRGRPTKRLPTISEIKGPRTRLARPSSVLKFGASELGSRDGENSTSPRTGRPPIYRPWECFVSENESLVSSIYNAPKILVENEDKGDNYGFKESLLRFVKDLGPTAQKVAASKLIKCLPKPPTPSQTPLILPHQTTQTLLIPSPSCPQSTNIASSYNLLHNLPARSSNLSYNQQNNTFRNPLNIQSYTQGNPLISSSGGIQIRDPIARGILKTNNLMFPLKEPSQGNEHVLGKRPILMDNITNANPNVFGSSFTGNRTYPSDQNLSTTIRQNLAQHQRQKRTNIQNSKFWLASHLRVFPVHDPNTGKSFMKTIDMIAEADKLQKGKKLQIVEHDYELFSSNWQSVLRRKQPVVDDHDLNDDEQLSSTNWQSRLEDFVNKNNIFDLKSTSGSFQAETSGNNWQYLMNSKSMCNSTETDQLLDGFRNGISSLQMLLSNDHQDHNPFPCGSSSSAQLGILPMPLYNETSCIMHERVGASSSAEHHLDQRSDFSTRELLLLKDSQQPDLALQL